MTGGIRFAAAAALALLAGCRAQPPAPAPKVDIRPQGRIEDSVQQPWQRPAEWMEIEAMRGGRPGTVLAARDGSGARLIEESASGYTIWELMLDCRRRTMQLVRAHGHVFDMSVQREPDPIRAIVTPTGIRQLCSTSAGVETKSPEDALKADMAKRGVTPRDPRGRPQDLIAGAAGTETVRGDQPR